MASKLEEIDDGLITGRPDTEIVDRLADELQKLDLTPNETRILLFLMTHGHSTASEVSRHTGIQRTETYNYISSLLAKGVVFSTFDRPQQYYTLTMQEVIDCLVETKRNALQQMSEKKIEYQQIIDKIISNIVIPEAEKKATRSLWVKMPSTQR
jgi:sugar-specific transcriptional regulator TrmB